MHSLKIRRFSYILLFFLLTLPSVAVGSDKSSPILVGDTLLPDTLPHAVPLVEIVTVTPITEAKADTLTPQIVARLEALTNDALLRRSQLGLYVYDLTADKPLFGKGEEQLLRPASTQKLVTAITALDLLGVDYCYRTAMYIKGEVCDSVLQGDLYLRGCMDPLLCAEDLKTFADSLLCRGIRSVQGRVVFDRSFKDADLRGWGWCWDDDVIPLTPLLYGGKPGLEERFMAALRAAGIQVPQIADYGTLPAEAQKVTECTHTIDQILLPMMKDSDNLYAESLFYHIAARSGQPLPGRKQGAAAVGALLERLGVRVGAYRVADGSGLSFYNYTTARTLVALLRHAYKEEAVYRHLEPSLPLAGEDGTLKRRMKNTSAAANVSAKTGTVMGVSALAGYCTAANGHRLCFAILNQGVLKSSDGRQFQDRVCEALSAPFGLK